MASPTRAKADNNLLGLSTSEARILLLGIVSTSNGKVNYEKVAQKGGWKNAASASTTYRNALRKFLSMHGGDSDGNAAATSTDTAPGNAEITPRKTPNKRRKPAASTAEGDTATDANDGEGDSPSKPKRARKPPVTKGNAAKGRSTTLFEEFPDAYNSVGANPKSDTFVRDDEDYDENFNPDEPESAEVATRLLDSPVFDKSI